MENEWTGQQMDGKRGFTALTSADKERMVGQLET
jgi:hypothetical protein